MASSNVAAALRKAGIDIENAALVLLDYGDDPEVRPGTRRSIMSAITRANDIASRLTDLADKEASRQ